MVDMRYQQINVNPTVFYQQHEGHTTILIVYVDDIIVTGDDEKKIAQLMVKLGKKIEVKDLRQLKYFLGIEVDRGAEGIVPSQMKHILDLLKEICMLGCKPVVTPINKKTRLDAEARELVDRERY
jgi:Reverse transcriptase (RNA-dependent DNA polymerase)